MATTTQLPNSQDSNTSALPSEAVQNVQSISSSLFFFFNHIFFCFWSSLRVFFSRFHRSFHGFEVVLLEELKAAPQPEAKRRRFKQALRCPKLQSGGPKLRLLLEVELFSSLYWQRDMRL